MKHNFECNRFCGENECNEKQNENPMLCKRVTDKLHIEQPSEEFKFWYERHFLQSQSLCKLEYNDEKMWEAWQAGQKSLGQMLKDNAELGKQPTQKWQELSDEEIESLDFRKNYMEIYHDTDDDGCYFDVDTFDYEFAKAIEQKLKEKNT